MTTRQTPDAVRALPSFLCRNGRRQFGVESSAIGPKMRSPVTVGADSSDKAYVVRATVAQASDMVSFEIRTPKFRQEWRRLIAPLANTVCPGEHIIANVSAALVHGTGGTGRGRGRKAGCGDGSGSQIGERRSSRQLGIQADRFAVQLRLRYEMKYDRRPRQSIDVRLGLDIPTCARKNAFKADPPALCLLGKDEQVFARCGMIADSAIARYHLHGALLPLACVAKAAVVVEAIAVADPMAGLTSENEDPRCAGGRGNAALLLTAEWAMDVYTAVIGLVNDKGPKHREILPEAMWSGKAPARNRPGQSRHFTGFAPAVPHFANLPLAALQRVAAGADFSGHLMNLPFASLHGAARAGVASSAAAVSAAAKIFISNLSIGRLVCPLADRVSGRGAAPVRFAS
jgi:hypothetical protein